MGGGGEKSLLSSDLGHELRQTTSVYGCNREGERDRKVQRYHYYSQKKGSKSKKNRTCTTVVMVSSQSSAAVLRFHAHGGPVEANNPKQPTIILCTMVLYYDVMSPSFCLPSSTTGAGRALLPCNIEHDIWIVLLCSRNRSASISLALP